MKINEYNDIMSYLTRKGNTSISGGPVLKSSNTAQQRLAKGTTSDTKPASKNSKMENWVNDNIAMYESDTATPEQVAGLEKRVAKARAQVAPSEKRRCLNKMNTTHTLTKTLQNIIVKKNLNQ